MANQRVVHEHGRRGAPQQSSELNLAPGGRQQVLSPDDEIDLLPQIIDGDGELVRPEPVPVAQQQRPALGAGILHLPTHPAVVERLGARRKDEPQPTSRRCLETAVRARQGIGHLVTRWSL